MLNVAYNTDCMEAMRQMPDKSFDLCVVDPPYGINANKFGMGDHLKNKHGVSRGDSYARRIEKGRLNSGGGEAQSKNLKPIRLFVGRNAAEQRIL